MLHPLIEYRADRGDSDKNFGTRSTGGARRVSRT
jgi:hypothetical protein